MHLLWFTMIAYTLGVTRAGDISSRIKRNVLFPPNAGMGLYIAVAFPVDLPKYEISLSYNFEANYLLPTNATELAYGKRTTEVRKARDATRARVYELLEERLEREGLLGRSCLLRLICETSASTILGHNGLLGELLHVILTPSSSEQENLSPEYSKAEEDGLDDSKNCMRYYAECPIDLYGFFSKWDT